MIFYTNKNTNKKSRKCKNWMEQLGNSKLIKTCVYSHIIWFLNRFLAFLTGDCRRRIDQRIFIFSAKLFF